MVDPVASTDVEGHRATLCALGTSLLPLFADSLGAFTPTGLREHIL